MPSLTQNGREIYGSFCQFCKYLQKRMSSFYGQNILDVFEQDILVGDKRCYCPMLEEKTPNFGENRRKSPKKCRPMPYTCSPSEPWLKMSSQNNF